MSFTLDFSTGYIQPVYNEIIFATSETETIYYNEFTSVAEVVVEGTAIANIQVQPNPDGYSVFDLHRVLESELTFDFKPFQGASETGKAFQLNSNTLKEYKVNFTGEGVSINRVSVGNFGGFIRVSTNVQLTDVIIGDTVTFAGCPVAAYNTTHTITSFPTSTSMLLSGAYISDTVTSDGTVIYKGDGSKWVITGASTSSKYIFNGVIDWAEFPTYNPNDLIFDLNNDTFFSSLDQTKTFDIDIDSRLWLNWFYDPTDTDSLIKEITVTTNNGVFTAENPYSGASETNKSQMLKLGPFDINQSTTTYTAVSGSLPAFDSDTTTYTVKYSFGPSGAWDVTYNFNMVDNCSKYEKYNFIYLDRFGCWIPVTFSLLSKTKVNIKKTEYKKGYGSFDGTTWGYNTYDRGKSRLNTEVKEVITLTSDWVSEYMSGFYEDMIESPEVYLVNKEPLSVIWQAVNILDTSYDVKTRINDKLINHNIKFEYSNANSSQRG